MKPPRKLHPKRNMAYHAIDIMRRGEPVLAEDLQHELGIASVAVLRHLREMYALDLIYICGWDRAYQRWIPVYRWGKHPDAPKPKPYTGAETGERYRQRWRERAKARAMIAPGHIGGATP